MANPDMTFQLFFICGISNEKSLPVFRYLHTMKAFGKHSLF